MMKTRLLLLFVGLLSLMSLTSCSDDDDNPFVGKWQFVSIEDMETIKMKAPELIDNLYKPLIFYSNGRTGYGKTKYSYDDRFLYFYMPSYNGTETYEYSFADDNNTLILTLKRIDSGDLDFVFQSSYLLLAKKSVYTRVK